MMRILTILLMLGVATAQAQDIFDFETDGQLANSPRASGDVGFFVESEDQALSGLRSLRFLDSGPESFEAFTYEDTTGMTSGTITVWFYDTTGFAPVGNPFAAQWGMSIILEDADDPADFGAVEICDLPYGSAGYYASEGTGDRLLADDRFDSGSPAARSIGWHRVDFKVGETITIISIDGWDAAQVAAPGGEKNLRLRVMADSASVGGFANWATHTEGEDSWPAAPGLVYVDDIAFASASPSTATVRLDFELEDEVADYDRLEEFMVAPGTNIEAMRGFVHAFDTTTSATHSGSNAAYFANGPAQLKQVAFSLDNIDDSTTQTATVNFYDLLGADTGFDKIGGAVILQSGTDPAHWIALEIWNAPYPFGGPAPNYYLTARPIPSGSGFYSDYFGDRATGWHTVEVQISATQSKIVLDGIENASGTGIIHGPGLDENPRLIVMADSPSMGGFKSFSDPATWTDSQTPELDTLALNKDADYLYFDDIALPSPVAAARIWSVYE